MQKLLLHIGLHKTGTTYFQRSVWPHWSGVSYAGKPAPNGHRSPRKALADMTDSPIVMISDESAGGSLTQSYLAGRSWGDLQSEALKKIREKFADKYEIHPIISLRHYQPWILSIYKHYLKYGGVDTLEYFLGVANHPPTMQLHDLFVIQKIRLIESELGVKPFVFFLEEINSQPDVLAKNLAEFADISDTPNFPSGLVFNEGANEIEARACRLGNRLLINPFCSGKGYIRRNKTLVFSLVRKLRKRGVIGKGGHTLSYSPEALTFVRENFETDLDAAVALAAAARGLDKTELRKVVESAIT